MLVVLVCNEYVLCMCGMDIYGALNLNFRLLNYDFCYLCLTSDHIYMWKLL